MSVTLEIPDDVWQAMRLPAPEVKARLQLELAISLYAQQILSLGKAAEVAGLSRWELNDILARRGVPMHYTEVELSEDLAYARRGE
jgi:predicted HTH domain antitoxin